MLLVQLTLLKEIYLHLTVDFKKQYNILTKKMYIKE